MAAMPHDRRTVILVLLFAAASLTVMMAFRTCGTIAFFFVVFWAAVPFLVLHARRRWREGRGGGP